MRQELRKAIDATKGLTSEELGTLRSHIAALLTLGPSSSDRILSATNHQDWVLMGICDYMRSAQIDLAGVEQLTAGKHYDTFRAKLPPVHRYIKKVGTVTQQRALLRMAIGLLHANMVNLGIPVSSRTMMANIHRIPAVINDQFPGYGSANLLGMIIRSQNNVRKKSSRKPIQHGRKGTDAS